MATISNVEARANRNATVAGLDLSDADIRRILAQRLGLLEDNYGKNRIKSQEGSSARGLGQSSIALKGLADLQQNYITDRNTLQGNADNDIAGNAIKRAAADSLMNAILSANAAAIAAQTPVTTTQASTPPPSTPSIPNPADDPNSAGRVAARTAYTPGSVDPGINMGQLSTQNPTGPFSGANPATTTYKPPVVATPPKPKPLPKPKIPVPTAPTRQSGSTGRVGHY